MSKIKYFSNLLVSELGTFFGTEQSEKSQEREREKGTDLMGYSKHLKRMPMACV